MDLHRVADDLDAGVVGFSIIWIVDGALPFSGAHMLSCLAIDGRFGLTAIGTSPKHAAELYEPAKEEVLQQVKP